MSCHGRTVLWHHVVAKPEHINRRRVDNSLEQRDHADREAGLYDRTVRDAKVTLDSSSVLYIIETPYTQPINQLICVISISQFEMDSIHSCALYPRSFQLL